MSLRSDIEGGLSDTSRSRRPGRRIAASIKLGLQHVPTTMTEELPCLPPSINDSNCSAINVSAPCGGNLQIMIKRQTPTHDHANT